MNKEFNWINFYLLGISLMDENDDAKMRTAISRFYYGAFCKSRDLLVKNNLFLNNKSKKIMESKSGRIHLETQNILENNKNIVKGKIISKHLKELRRMRNKSDYDKIIDESLSEMLIDSQKRSKLIFNLLNNEFNQ